MEKQYNYIDGVIQAGESLTSITGGLINCVANPALCAAQAITEWVTVGINTVNKIETNKVIKKQLEAQDYMIRQQINFEKWAAKTEQEITRVILKGQIDYKRITQKSQLKIMGILRDYYILKTNQYVKENILQTRRIKTLIITILVASVLGISGYLLIKKI